ncbi:MAG: hypothetical protein ACOH14_03765 [Rhodoglobus sp.]
MKSPCGRDRQVLADYYPNIRVLQPSPTGIISVVATDLLPLNFNFAAEQV